MGKRLEGQVVTETDDQVLVDFSMRNPDREMPCDHGPRSETARPDALRPEAQTMVSI